MPQFDRLGLKENPFKNKVEQRYFYADQSRAQILDSTEHLIDYSSNFQVILGDSGIGKSHLLEVLANRVNNNWRVAKVTNAEQYDTISLVQAVLDSFDTKADVHKELLETLETQLAEINQLGFKPVLFVDSTQALSIDSLRFLIQLSQQKQAEEPYINIVLFSSVEVTELLQGPELRNFRDIVHITALSPFDKEGVSAYLRHKMAVAGFDRESPFTPRIIDSIYNDSRGIPEKIDFFADKFLTSSGKAENYIQADSTNARADNLHFNNTSNDHNNVNDELNTGHQSKANNEEQEKDLLVSLNDEDLSEDRNDRAEQQLNRLAEQFEEIEQMSDSGEFLDDEVSRSGATDKVPDSESASGLAKFMIPIAIIGVLITALIIINTVFERSGQDELQTDKEKIKLLPLELPDELLSSEQNSAKEKIIKPESKAIEKSLAQEEEQLNKSDPDVENPQEKNVQEITADSSKSVATLELIEAGDSKTEKQSVLPLKSDESEGKSETVDSSEIRNNSKITHQTHESTDVVLTPKLKSVEPEPVIGSNKRQYITINGDHLKKDSRLIISWDDKHKEFSEIQTPEQWQYINEHKIKLHLSTGIKSRQWKVMAKNSNDSQSAELGFNVVMPFISKMAIKSILPKPFIGSAKRQAITIEGNGFSKETVIELRWDKNKKHFSSRLTPNQFEYISPNQLKLFIVTGIKKRKWTVVAISPTGATSHSSFTVVDKISEDIKAAELSAPGSRIHGETWLRQQADKNYTIQLFGSHNKSAIDELIKKFALTGDILSYSTQRNGRNWYTMTYGSYSSKQSAEAAVKKLPLDLVKNHWIRNFADIKKQLLTQKTAVAPVLPDPVNIKKKITTAKNEAWIWTQNPADYTIQIIALSTETGIKDFIRKHALQSQSAYFKTLRGGKRLYVLIYGHYANKNSAELAARQLLKTIRGSKLWVRKFSEVHDMMERP